MKNSEAKNFRLAMSVSKKLGNAVVRNKVRRQVRMMAQQIINFDNSMHVLNHLRQTRNLVYCNMNIFLLEGF